MSARRLALVLVAAVAAAALAYTLYWFHASGQVRNHLLRWAEEHRAAGGQVDWRDVEAGGFPWRLSLTLRQPALTTTSGLSWQAETLTLWALPPWPRALHLSTHGRQHVAWRGRDAGFSLDSLAATIAAGSLDAHLHGFSHSSGLAVADLGLTVAALPPRPDPGGHPASWRFAISARDLDLPAAPLPGLERSLALAELSGRVMGAVPDAALVAGPVAAIAGWSKQGGVVELDRIALDWPPLGLEGNGTAAFDPTGQPLVALATRIRGADALMDRLAGHGGLDPASARTAKTILALMSRPDAIAAPLSVQDGQLYLGPARLTSVPAIPWADFSAP